MGFVESFVAWMIVILFLALIVIGILTFILNYFQPPSTEDGTSNIPADEVTRFEQESRLKRNIFLVIVAVLAVLTVTGGINGFMNLHG